ncbi:hypothetical protein F5J12DRAFT_786249 [Pisolithus orientalis]|uniref:uncharacterized protein n=1 Tax=Pisolithus orientalis TaxID=936130 RepID=UPI002224B3F3|nr:uncharacterized protein F5J12DRAFT_786249 [Pisolithus orientalis]KAI5992018.1 hypothetical protein F5J12DRAFT_786249 [Pisolithus orientalis]
MSEILLTTEADAKDALRQRIAIYFVCDESPAGVPTNISVDDVFLFPCGVPAMWNVHQLLLASCPSPKNVVSGNCFVPALYTQTLKIVEENAIFYGHGRDYDTDCLYTMLTRKVAENPSVPPIPALYTECSSKPLLPTVNIPRKHKHWGGASESEGAVIKQVWYPNGEQDHENRGYGGLFSLTFTSLEASRAFYDALDVAKDPSYGTAFTSTYPYTLLGHYWELEFAAEYGVEEGLLRVGIASEGYDSEIVELCLRRDHVARTNDGYHIQWMRKDLFKGTGYQSTPTHDEITFSTSVPMEKFLQTFTVQLPSERAWQHIHWDLELRVTELQ